MALILIIQRRRKSRFRRRRSRLANTPARIIDSFAVRNRRRRPPTDPFTRFSNLRLARNRGTAFLVRMEKPSRLSQSLYFGNQHLVKVRNCTRRPYRNVSSYLKQVPQQYLGCQTYPKHRYHEDFVFFSLTHEPEDDSFHYDGASPFHSLSLEIFSSFLCVFFALA